MADTARRVEGIPGLLKKDAEKSTVGYAEARGDLDRKEWLGDTGHTGPGDTCPS